MSIKSAPFYWIECDFDGCDSRCPPKDHEITAWADESQAVMCAEDSDWRSNGLGLWACETHANRLCEQCGADAGPLAGERDYLCETCAETVV